MENAGAASAVGLGSDAPPPYIRWEYRNPSRHKNGPAVVEMYLVSGDGSPVEDASWFYRFLPLASFRQVMEIKEEPVMRAGTFDQGDAEGRGFLPGEEAVSSVFRLGKDDAPHGDKRLIVASGTYVLAEVMAKATVGGRTCYAQTAMLLFGDSMGGEPLVSNTVDPHWPSYGFMGSGELYWPQTGQTYTLTVREGEILGHVTAVRDDGPVPGAFVYKEGGTDFTPDHDPELSRESSSATKPVYLVGRTADGGTLSYTFYIHRSRYAASHLSWGVGVSILAFFLTGAVILAFSLKRRAWRHAPQAV
jgi:hypothetical protein